MDFDAKDCVEVVQKNWHSPLGIIIAVIVLFLSESIILKNLNASILTICIVLIISTFTIICIWILANILPKTKKNKVGFVVSIKCTDDEQYKKIREDFIDNLRKLIKQGNLGSTFQFIEVPRHIANKIIDYDDAQLLRAKTKAHFLIYGRVRLRKLNDQNCHIIDLDGIVAHKPISKELSSQLSKEFTELLPKQLRVPTENDLLTLQITSDMTECVAKYIIGIASECSHDLDYAEYLFKDVQMKVENHKTNLPNIIRLKNRLPLRFREINEARSRYYYGLWRKNNDSQYLNNFSHNLRKISDDDVLKDFGLSMLRSIDLFLNGRNVDKAIELVENFKQYNEPISYFNLAFLKAYKGDLKKAIQCYRKCENLEISTETLSAIEEFLVWIIDQEPDKYQFYYCLGFFNWKFKEDYCRANKDFEEFISLAKQETLYGKEIDLAIEWNSKLKKMIDVSVTPETICK